MDLFIVVKPTVGKSPTVASPTPFIVGTRIFQRPWAAHIARDPTYDAPPTLSGSVRLVTPLSPLAIPQRGWQHRLVECPEPSRRLNCFQAECSVRSERPEGRSVKGSEHSQNGLRYSR